MHLAAPFFLLLALLWPGGKGKAYSDGSLAAYVNTALGWTHDWLAMPLNQSPAEVLQAGPTAWILSVFLASAFSTFGHS